MELVTVDGGARLATWTTGTARDQPPVVLLHGGPGLWDYLQPLAEMLDDVTLVHRYDQRGCGRSDTGGPLTMARYLADLDELRGHWDHERWTVIGHSFGATLAMAYAATHPEHVAAVGYICGVGIGNWQEPFRDEKRRRARPHQQRLDELAAKARVPEEEIEWRMLTWSTDYADTDRGYECARPMAEQPWPINLDANREVTFSDDDCIAWAAQLRCPITFVLGRPIRGPQRTRSCSQIGYPPAAGGFSTTPDTCRGSNSPIKSPLCCGRSPRTREPTHYRRRAMKTYSWLSSWNGSFANPP